MNFWESTAGHDFAHSIEESLSNIAKELKKANELKETELALRKKETSAKTKEVEMEEFLTELVKMARTPIPECNRCGYECNQDCENCDCTEDCVQVEHDYCAEHENCSAEHCEDGECPCPGHDEVCDKVKAEREEE